ncbi:hypothetical protein [uncultured Paraglaciecola sp.]|uniref:hypothetical protein n=1 Tax=uncultured Paraglaciecola sp. TaxID=1765024 RepID=UPI0030D7366E|tara:strand:+ start:16734 stop:17528 length:795 start_codon:yes stop_codon:yes gene_type:complete
MQKVFFWNGNKSAARQNYELALLEACLEVTAQDYAAVDVRVDNTDYPRAADETNIFATGADILVTVAGNVKFKDIPKLVITQPLTKGLLGYRLLLVRNESLASFSQINTPQQLQALSIGVPQTWADAELFRHNQYKVIEQGTLDDLFLRLKNGSFDYVALGVNEIEEIYASRVATLEGISIEPSLMLYYPFPLVFYVSAAQPILAQRVKTGLNKIIVNGEFESLFERHHGDVVQRLKLRDRAVLTLNNPALPIEMNGFSGSLLD